MNMLAANELDNTHVVTLLKLGPYLYSPFIMVKMYPFVMVGELSVKLWQTLMLVVYSNIFDICYYNLYAANRFVCHLVREYTTESHYIDIGPTSPSCALFMLSL